MDVREVGNEKVTWKYVAQDMVSSMPSIETVSFSRKTILYGIISTAICTYCIITTNRPLVCATN